MDGMPVIALVGAPNVGKSTLFNRLCRRRRALVHDLPGVTRDRHYGRAFFGEGQTRQRRQHEARQNEAGQHQGLQREAHPREAILIDTGGLISPTDADLIGQGINAQVRLAIDEADIVVCIFDGKAGPTAGDQELVQFLRPLKAGGKRIFYVVNKVDSDARQDRLYAFHELGVGDDLHGVSAEHGLGIEDLKSQLMGAFTEFSPGEPVDDDFIRVGIIGRPNVGKSSLINYILGQERSLVTPVAGTTRDSVDSLFSFGNRRYRLCDTAGIRAVGKTRGLEGLSVIKALQAIERAHVIVLVVDLAQGVTEQDAKIAGLALERGRGVLILGNKMDLLPDAREKDVLAAIAYKLQFLTYAPVLLGSAKTGSLDLRRFFGFINRIEAARHLEVSTQDLNRYIHDVLAEKPLPMRKGRRLKVFYATQAVARDKNQRLRPAVPRFVFFMNDPKALNFSDKRFLVNALRRRFTFFGNPIEVEFRARGAEKTAV